MEPTPGSVARIVREQTAKPGNSPDWVSLVDLRKRLGGTREQQDLLLKQMSAAGKLHIVPEDNRKMLKPEDHANAIRLGGEDNHLVSLS